jgi:hypothetical protein
MLNTPPKPHSEMKIGKTKFAIPFARPVVDRDKSKLRIERTRCAGVAARLLQEDR